MNIKLKPIDVLFFIVAILGPFFVKVLIKEGVAGFELEYLPTILLAILYLRAINSRQ